MPHPINIRNSVRKNSTSPVEKALIVSEIRYRRLFESAKDGILILDAETGTILDVNPFLINLLGYSKENLMQKAVWEIGFLKDIVQNKDKFLELQQNEYIRYENLPLETAEGRKINVEFVSNVYMEGRQKVIQCNIRDTTERRRMENQIVESEEKFRLIFENSADSIFITDKEGKYLYANKQATKLLGYSNKEILMLTIADISPANRLEEYAKDFQRLFTQGSFYSEIELVKKDGSLVQSDLNAVTLPNGWIYGSCRDITDRKKLETNLSTATEIAKLGYWEFDVKSGNIIFNDQYYRIIHGSSTEKQGGNVMSTEEFVRRLVHPEDAKMIGENMQVALSSPDPEYFGQAEARVFCANGEIKNVMVRFKAIKDQFGDSPTVYGISQDITERKLAEEKMSILAKFPSENPEPVLRISKDGRLLFANEASYSILTWKLETGKPVPAVLKNIVNVAFKQKKFLKIEIENNKRIFSVHAAPILDSNYVNLYIRDITQRKLAEDEITKLAYALKSINECVSITDLEDKIIFVNDSFLKTYGYIKKELIGENIKIVRSQNNEAKFVKKILLNTSKGGWKGELWNKRKDGSEFLIHLSTTIIIDTKGRPLGLIGVASDITEKKRFELELIRAKEKAEESDRLKSAFLANMSHEIRTPMNGILGFAGLLKEPDLTGEEQQEYIKIIEKSGARMLNIISEIVDISRIESGQMEVRYKETNINKLVENIFKLLKLDAEDKGINFSLKNSVTVKETLIQTDSEKLYSILTNLVKNAIKYTDKGSIEFGFKNFGNYLEFYVKDTGIGIPSEKLEVIFERFIQADIEDMEARQGAGLGLAIAKAFVELLRGKIWVESEQGKGSIFHFTIPIDHEPEEQDTSSQVVPPDGARPKIDDLKILITEDDETSARLISIMINDFGKEIINAKTGSEAVQICRSNPDIDLILMDIQMPDMNGFEATRQIRQFNKDVIIIAQTAYGLVGDRRKAIEAGCNDYISKPIGKDELLALIQMYFKK